MKTLLLIDGNAILHRAYFALPHFKSAQGIPTNAVYGFFSMVDNAIKAFSPTHVVIAFDTPKPTFRVKLLPSYQAQRPKSADDFVSQFPLVMDLIDGAGLIRIEKDGFEADDVIGTVACHYKDNGIRVFILSGDRDILQLVDKNVFVIAPLTGISKIAVYNEEEVVKKFGINPDQIPDLKALIGDPSDNYTGAKGIGPKSAAKLINEFGTIENIYKNIDKVNEKTKALLEEYKDNVLLSKRLATIVCDVKVGMNLEKSEFKGFGQAMKKRLEELELKSLLKRFFETPQPKKPIEEHKKEDTDQMGLF